MDSPDNGYSDMDSPMIREAKEYVRHDIAPTLTPNIKGQFSVRLIGVHRNHAEIELRIVNENREVIKSFGSKVIPVGESIRLQGIDSTINFLPKEYGV